MGFVLALTSDVGIGLPLEMSVGRRASSDTADNAGSIHASTIYSCEHI